MPDLVSRLPEPLLREGPGGLAYWQWLALPSLLIVALLVGLVASWAVRRLLGHVVARRPRRWIDLVRERGHAPLAWALALVLLWAGLPLVALPQAAEHWLRELTRAGLLLVVFWMLLRAVDVGLRDLEQSAWSREHPASRSLAPLAGRVAKIVIVSIAFVEAVSLLGFPVASLVAGLGLGGLALALAAQKTVENLFGAFALGVDQPLRAGDFVRVEDVMGTVENIGLRSTRIRTLERTVVSIPNGKLAELRIESFALRDRIRFTSRVVLPYGTRAAQVRQVLLGIERLLCEHPRVRREDVVVRLKELGESGLELEIIAAFVTTDFGEFMQLRQDALLAILEEVEKAGARVAYPTRTVHVASGDA